MTAVRVSGATLDACWIERGCEKCAGGDEGRWDGVGVRGGRQERRWTCAGSREVGNRVRSVLEEVKGVGMV